MQVRLTEDFQALGTDDELYDLGEGVVFEQVWFFPGGRDGRYANEFAWVAYSDDGMTYQVPQNLLSIVTRLTDSESECPVCGHPELARKHRQVRRTLTILRDGTPERQVNLQTLGDLGSVRMECLRCKFHWEADSHNPQNIFVGRIFKPDTSKKNSVTVGLTREEALAGIATIARSEWKREWSPSGENLPEDDEQTATEVYGGVGFTTGFDVVEIPVEGEQ